MTVSSSAITKVRKNYVMLSLFLWLFFLGCSDAVGAPAASRGGFSKSRSTSSVSRVSMPSAPRRRPDYDRYSLESNPTSFSAKSAEVLRSKTARAAASLAGIEIDGSVSTDINNLDETTPSPGYIALYKFQNDQNCSSNSAPDYVSTVTLGACFSNWDEDSLFDDAALQNLDFYYYYYQNPSERQYSIWTYDPNEQDPTNPDLLVVQVSYYADSGCSSLMGTTAAILPITCSLANTTIPTSLYYAYSQDMVDFPSTGSLVTVYPTASSCSGEVTQEIWRGQDYCYIFNGSSYSLSCTSSIFETAYIRRLFSSLDCSGKYTTIQSHNPFKMVDSCTTGVVDFIQTCYGAPESYPCVNDSDILYTKAGRISMVETLAKCLFNLGGNGVLYPGYDTGTAVNVSTFISLNNLISIDEVKNTVSLDVFIVLEWIDERLVMPGMFTPESAKYGIDITPALFQQNEYGQQLEIWLPNFVFPDAQSIEVTDQYVRLYKNGMVAWNQHIVLTLLQSSFHYENYPNDQQTVHVRFYSFSIVDTEVRFFPVRVHYMYSDGGVDAITLNPIWSYVHAEPSFGSKAPGEIYTGRAYAAVNITFQRQSVGIVLRLALPMFLLVLLAALSFWADPRDRVASTVPMLLAISALYVVVIQNIPMIGYLTKFDFFVVSMFSLLFLSVLLHLLILRLSRDEKLSKLPLRRSVIRILEMTCRIVIVPVVTALFLIYFRETYTYNQIVFSSTIVGSFMFVIVIKEMFSLRHTLRKSARELDAKQKSIHRLSGTESFVFNLINSAKLNSQENATVEPFHGRVKVSDEDEGDRGDADSTDGLEAQQRQLRFEGHNNHNDEFVGQTMIMHTFR